MPNLAFSNAWVFAWSFLDVSLNQLRWMQGVERYEGDSTFTAEQEAGTEFAWFMGASFGCMHTIQILLFRRTMDMWWVGSLTCLLAWLVGWPPAGCWSIHPCVAQYECCR